MGKFFVDLSNGKSGFTISDNMGMDEDGNLLMRTSTNTAIDMDSGELHILSNDPFEDDNSNDDIFDDDDDEW